LLPRGSYHEVLCETPLATVPKKGLVAKVETQPKFIDPFHLSGSIPSIPKLQVVLVDDSSRNGVLSF
jgi:hypothetical protein